MPVAHGLTTCKFLRVDGTSLALPHVAELGNRPRLAGWDEDRVVTEALRAARLGPSQPYGRPPFLCFPTSPLPTGLRSAMSPPGVVRP